MSSNETNTARAATCVNEACARPAEPGERYCGECGLERSLYFRESREADPRADALRETARRLFGG
jgi:hypothetical protein